VTIDRCFARAHAARSADDFCPVFDWHLSQSENQSCCPHTPFVHCQPQLDDLFGPSCHGLPIMPSSHAVPVRVFSLSLIDNEQTICRKRRQPPHVNLHTTCESSVYPIVTIGSPNPCKAQEQRSKPAARTPRKCARPIPSAPFVSSSHHPASSLWVRLRRIAASLSGLPHDRWARRKCPRPA